MPTELHDLDALEALAEGGGAAADWANLRLALRAPRSLKGLPADPWEALVCLATAGETATGALLDRLRASRRDPVAAELTEAISLFGLLPEDPGPWIEAARGALRGDGRDGDALLASLLAELGVLDREVLGAAARATSERVWYVVPGLVLRFAERHEPSSLGEVAAEVAASLARQEPSRPGLVGLALARLGVPLLAVEEPDPDDAVRLGAGVAGADPPSLWATRGSARRRARRTAQDLLERVPGPAAALIRALARIEEGPEPFELAAAAAWLAAVQGEGPGDPVREVVVRGAGEDAAVLTRARRAVGPADAEALGVAMVDLRVRRVPAAALAIPLIAEDLAPLLRDLTAERALLGGAVDPRLGVAGCVALARAPEWVLELLEDPDTVDLGLGYARYTAVEEVLSALLEHPVPADPERRELLGRALCDQGDRAALERLEAMGAAFPEDERLAAAVARGRALLGDT